MIIGLSGKMQSGKTTVADHLVEAHGFEKIGFADTIKEFAYDLNPIIVSTPVGEDSLYNARLQEIVDAWGWEEAKKTREVRRTLQEIGTQMRKQKRDIWIDLAFAKMLPGHDYVIHDVRFKNEALNIDAQGGSLWRIVRAEAVGDEHVSETELDDYEFDLVIGNNHTVESLLGAVDAIIDRD